MKVSIIIPVYNVAEYISDCLKSVLQQTYKDLEIIIVNDETEDNSMAIIAGVLKESGTSIPYKIIEHTKNQGLSAARNTGIKNSTGDYLYFLDSDDEITPDCISSLLSSVLSYNCDIVIGDYKVVGSNDFFPPLKIKSSIINNKKSVIRSYMKERIYVMAWNKLVRRDFILRNSLFFKEGIIHEDLLWSFQTICQSRSIGIVKTPTYIYKVRSNSIKTGTVASRDIRDLRTILKEMVEFAKANRLIENKYVYSFIEEEKLRLLYAYERYGMISHEELNGLYQFISNLTIPSRKKILMWSFFKTRKCLRDAHYFLSHSNASEYYKNVPMYLAQRKKIFNKFRFYRWFISILIRSLLNQNSKARLLRLK